MSFCFELLESTWDERFLWALREHYTESQGPPPGKKLAWRVVGKGGKTVGWLGLGEPAYKLAPRRRLGLEDARPLPRTVCCFVWRRVLRTEERSSEILRAWHEGAELDWEERYGWRPVHWETMVDPSRVLSPVPGACFRRAGYRSLGVTTGRGARRPRGSSHGPRVWGDTTPKLVFYRGPLPRLPKSR